MCSHKEKGLNIAAFLGQPHDSTTISMEEESTRIHTARFEKEAKSQNKSYLHAALKLK